MINTDPLSYVISTLTRLKNIKEANYWYQNLLDIQKDISEYNQTTIGCGISLFQNIISKMKEIQKSPNYIQIDMKTATKQNSLQNSSKRELEDFIDAMLRIAPEHKIPDEYASYIAAFIKLNQKGRNLMTTYDDFNLDLQHATSTQSDDERLLTADAVCAATWAVCVPVSENFCSPGNICDLTDECTNDCQGGTISDAHSYCGSAC